MSLEYTTFIDIKCDSFKTLLVLAHARFLGSCWLEFYGSFFRSKLTLSMKYKPKIGSKFAVTSTLKNFSELDFQLLFNSRIILQIWLQLHQFNSTTQSTYKLNFDCSLWLRMSALNWTPTLVSLRSQVQSQSHLESFQLQIVSQLGVFGLSYHANLIKWDMEGSKNTYSTVSFSKAFLTLLPSKGTWEIEISLWGRNRKFQVFREFQRTAWNLSQVSL